MTMTGSKASVDASASPPMAVSSVLPFHAVYQRYLDFVWASAGHLGAGTDAIDDVVQDVFIVVHSKLATLQRPEALRSWLYGIVRRTVSDYRRSRRTRDAAVASLGAEPRSRQPSPLDVAERDAELELLENILSDLDEPKREIFVMVEVLEMTVPEVVQVLEIPINTAYSRLRLARQSFEDALARHALRDKEAR